MRNAIGRGAVSLGVMGILLLAATEAGAGQTFCGSTSAGWNVPNGDAVLVSSRAQSTRYSRRSASIARTRCSPTAPTAT